MKEPFAVSTSNKWYFGIVAVLLLIVFVVQSDKTAEQAGALTGTLIFFLLAPLLFAWIVWLLSGKRAKAGSWTFNIVLTLVLLATFGRVGNDMRHSQSLEEMNELKEQFRKEIANTDDPQELAAAYDKFADSVKDGLSNWSEGRAEPEKRFYGIMSDFITESQTAARNWSESYNAVLSPRILDYSVLNSEEEFNHQSNVLQDYVEETETYYEFYSNMVPDLKQRLSVLGEENEYAKGAIKAATEKHRLQKTVIEPLLKTHIQYGRNMVQILEILRKNEEQWAYDNGELVIYSDNLLDRFNGLIADLADNEKKINTLSERVRGNLQRQNEQ